MIFKTVEEAEKFKKEKISELVTLHVQKRFDWEGEFFVLSRHRDGCNCNNCPTLRKNHELLNDNEWINKITKKK